LIVLLSIVVTYFMNRITSGWELVLSLGAGTGLVYILRWYWWRVNAWSEVSAMTAALVISLALRYFVIFDATTPKGFALQILITVGVTTVVWLATTVLTAPEPVEKLVSFVQRVRLAGVGWRRIRQAAGLPDQQDELLPNLLNWICGIMLVYAILFAIGQVIFGVWTNVILLLFVAMISGALMWWNLSRTSWAGIAETIEPRIGPAVHEGAD
jgi:hypothetical protein